jgi:hypothetical protein
MVVKGNASSESDRSCSITHGALEKFSDPSTNAASSVMLLEMLVDLSRKWSAFAEANIKQNIKATNSERIMILPEQTRYFVNVITSPTWLSSFSGVGMASCVDTGSDCLNSSESDSAKGPRGTPSFLTIGD